MKDRKFLRCICCGGFAFHRFKGWWIHKKCLEELRGFLHLWEVERVPLKLKLINWEKAILSFYNNPEEFREYNDVLEHEAWKAFEEKHGLPSWVTK